MISHKRILKNIAKRYGTDSDVLTVILWDHSKKFEYIKNENSVVKDKDFNLVKTVIDSKIRNTLILKENIVSGSEKIVELEYKNFNFSHVGRITHPLFFISKDEVLKIYNELVEDFSSVEDPISPAGLKHEHLLDSALFHMQTSFKGITKYPTIESAAAALMYSLSNNHPFHNGNKRTAMVAMLVFLDKHNMILTCDEDELFKISIKVADRKLVEEKYKYPDAEIFELAYWIHHNGKVMTKGERQITLKKLKQILNHFDCEVLDSGKVRRKVIKTNIFGRPKEVDLTSKKVIGSTISEGKEVDKNLIRAIREDLELTTEHGIDSDVFYKKFEYTSSDFIIKYKNLLRRLSKV